MMCVFVLSSSPPRRLCYRAAAAIPSSLGMGGNRGKVPTMWSRPVVDLVSHLADVVVGRFHGKLRSAGLSRPNKYLPIKARSCHLCATRQRERKYCASRGQVENISSSGAIQVFRIIMQSTHFANSTWQQKSTACVGV